MSNDWAAIEQEAASLLSRYVQIDTTNPPGNEALAADFLAETMRQYGLEPQVLVSAPGRASVVTRIAGRGDGRLGPLLLYSHSDVVPAEAADWSAPPFSGAIKDGYVWGRGALDDKGMGVIHLLALAHLQHLPLERDVILLIAADEEVGGMVGVKWLLDNHPDLIKAEYVWDEGGWAWPV